jgi:pimeloyl-ACP methyl ester carboxylesterase
LCGDQVVAIAGIAPGPPGNIQPEPEMISEGPNEVVVRTPQRTIVLRDEGANRANRAFIEGKLIGASRQFPRDRLDAYAGMLTHTGSRLLYERQNVHGSQVRLADPTCFAGKPIMVLTGSDDLDHPRELDEEVAEWLALHGAIVRFVWLPDKGIEGNGHMLMMERNSDAIADIVIDWLDHQAF